MDDTLQHDPRTKQYIKDVLYSFLYDPIEKQLKRQLDALIIKNSVLIGASHTSFMYKGTLYSIDDSRPPRKMNMLVNQLHPFMDEYLKEVKKLNNVELPYVLGFITQVLNSSNDLHDYLRVLPDSIHRPIEKIIASCPCRSKHLTEDVIESLQTKNKVSIDLIKQRMVTNLLI